jgi:centrin-3
MNMNNPNMNMNMNFGTTSRVVGGGVVPVSGRRRPMRTELTDEQKAEIREAFEIFDMDKDGALDFHEFKVKYSYYLL